MFPMVTHYDLLIVSAFTIAIVVAGFSWMAYVAHRLDISVTEARQSTQEAIRISRAVAALVYQEEEKTRALLRQHGAP